MKKNIRIVAINIYHKDAIGNFCYDLVNLYEKAGYCVHLYSDGHDQDSFVKQYELLFSEITDQDIIFYHHSIYDKNIERISLLNAKKIVYFHGITPPELLKKYEPITAKQCEEGLKQLRYFNQFDVLCVNSISTANQMKQHITPVLIPQVIPPIIATRNILQNIKKTLLSVGRVVPHKKLEDIVKLVSVFVHKFPNVEIELKVIGVFPENDYQKSMLALISQLNISDKIIFEGFVTDEELMHSYAVADCYVIMSEHEGFGVPLLEALKSDIPILAYQKNSVGEVLGNSGCQVVTKDFDQLADLLHQILFDEDFRQKILLGQRKRLKKLMAACDEKIFLQLISTQKECLI